MDNPAVLILFTYLCLFSLCPTATYLHLLSFIFIHRLKIPSCHSKSNVLFLCKSSQTRLSLSLKSHVYLSEGNKEIAGVWVVKFSQIKNLWILVVELWPQLPTIRTSKLVLCTHKWVCTNLSYFTRHWNQLRAFTFTFLELFYFIVLKVHLLNILYYFITYLMSQFLFILSIY